jgi:hypothetical protein
MNARAWIAVSIGWVVGFAFFATYKAGLTPAPLGPLIGSTVALTVYNILET